MKRPIKRSEKRMKSIVLKYGLRIALFSITAGALVLGGAFYYLYGNSVGDGSHRVDFEVRPGVGSYTVARDLEEAGLIRDATAFRWLLRATFRGSSVKAGYYELNDGMSPEKIADVLTEGKVRMTRFTIPEGWNNRQIGEHLANKGFVSSKEEFLRLTRSEEVLRRFQIPAQTTEGYLFPDTYTIPIGYPPEKIHEAMVKRFFDVLGGIQDGGVDPETLHRKLILASIIEREAAKPEELPMMASVFLNRIEDGMRLESCATVQYLLPEPREKLYDRDLQIKSPYNTYKNAGLPPGPISNPGEPALDAAFHPDANPYLFFVLKPDGSHYFSTSYDEHLRAKKKYLGS